jgi:uncharacterized repeat protein (TIGR04076 family)
MTEQFSDIDTGFRVVARVLGQEGHCGAGHQVGDEIVFDQHSVRGKICLDALCAFMPWVLSMRYGAEYPWEEDKETVQCACPDPANPVVFELRRIR